MIWVPYNAATHLFVSSWGSDADATFKPMYNNHAWSAPPSYKITAKLWVFSEETVQTKNRVEDQFELVFIERCRYV